MINMPSDKRTNVILDEETKTNLDLIADHIQAGAGRGRSQAIRFAASEMVRILGLAKKKNGPKKKDT